MKKILPAIILGFLTIGLFGPLANLALAQIGGENLNACCEISSKFNAFNKPNGAGAGAVDYPITWDHKKVCVVGEAGGGCVIDGKTYTLANASDLKLDSVNKIYTCGGTAAGAIAIEGWGIVCLLNTVYNVTNWIFYLMMIGVVILFVIAAAMFMMSSGDAEKTKKAKNMMVYAIIGLVIALVAKLVPSVVKLIVGM
ncbi:MAG: pilin [Candidatus Gribaldobacteria bacterium]|nr:pilin [Candidatus Gribaldobacteria bacterium]